MLVHTHSLNQANSAEKMATSKNQKPKSYMK